MVQLIKMYYTDLQSIFTYRALFKKRKEKLIFSIIMALSRPPTKVIIGKVI
jgi:hypothetical protein